MDLGLPLRSPPLHPIAFDDRNPVLVFFLKGIQGRFLDDHDPFLMGMGKREDVAAFRIEDVPGGAPILLFLEGADEYPPPVIADEGGDGREVPGEDQLDP